LRLGRRPGREADAEQAFRAATAAGDSRALHELARWLRRRSGRQADAEQAYRTATAAGDPRAVRELAFLPTYGSWLNLGPGLGLLFTQVLQGRGVTTTAWMAGELDPVLRALRLQGLPPATFHAGRRRSDRRQLVATLLQILPQVAARTATG
jgi:hypothetical protein